MAAAAGTPVAAPLNLISRHDRLSYQAFRAGYLEPNRPVVITGAISHWPALTKWTPEFFEGQHGAATATIDDRTYTMRELVGLVRESRVDSPAPYLRNQRLELFIPELQQDTEPKPDYFFPNWLDGPLTSKLRPRFHRGSTELYLGGAGGAFPFLHYDLCHTHAFISQIYGEKRFVMYAPDQAQWLYPEAKFPNISSVDDLKQPDLTRYPLLARATAIETVLKPGETLFVPAGWWHTAEMLTISISVSTNVVNASNWRWFKHDLCAGLSRAGWVKQFGYLSALGLARTLYRR